MSVLGRVVELELGVAGAPGVRITGLRIGFRVRHTAKPAPSEATISVYNPSPQTIALARRPDATVRLLAGYATTTVRQVFEGAVLRDGARAVRQGPDRILTIEAADGLAGLQRTVRLSYVQPVTVGAVLAQVLAQTGWARGVITIEEGRSLPSGITHVGPVGPVLDRLTRGHGATWYVRDGALYVTAIDGAVPEEAPQFSASAGNLVGSPAPTDEGIEVTALLDAGMRPGRRFSLVSEAYSGTYVARDVAFVGDSGWEAPFYVQVQGVVA